MTNTELDKLLSLLRKHSVTYFKKAGLEISLSPSTPKSPKLKDPVLAPPLATHIPDFRADDTMSYDKVLNWSGSPDPNEIPMPLTGDEPI